MDTIKEFTQLNFSAIFLSLILIGISFQIIMRLLDWIVERFGIETKRTRQRREEHELLIKTSENLTELQKQHTKSVEDSAFYDKQIRDELHSFMNDMKESIAETKSEIKQIDNNRVNDGKQYLKVQQELSNSIREIIDYNETRDTQIDNLMTSQREILADRINQKYKHYISIKGIPEDEVDEFTNLHNAYNGVGGNHSGDAKYNYCMNHLDVIPVETKLIIK